MTQAIYPVPAEFGAAARIKPADYDRLVAEARDHPDAFWARELHRLDWMTVPTRMSESSFGEADFAIRWFADGELNLSVNCIDRHLPERADQVAIVFEGDEPGEGRSITYRELHEEVCRFANVLKSQGVTKGDRVTLYMPMIPEAAFAMLACARIGAIHSIVFGGFSPDSLAGRIQDCDSTLVVTADEGMRGGKRIPLKANVDAALNTAPASKPCWWCSAPAQTCRCWRAAISLTAPPAPPPCPTARPNG